MPEGVLGYEAPPGRVHPCPVAVLVEEQPGQLPGDRLLGLPRPLGVRFPRGRGRGRGPVRGRARRGGLADLLRYGLPRYGLPGNRVFLFVLFVLFDLFRSGTVRSGLIRHGVGLGAARWGALCCEMPEGP